MMFIHAFHFSCLLTTFINEFSISIQKSDTINLVPNQLIIQYYFEHQVIVMHLQLWLTYNASMD